MKTLCVILLVSALLDTFLVPVLGALYLVIYVLYIALRSALTTILNKLRGSKLCA